MLDAVVAAWSAARIAREARSPKPPELDVWGDRMGMGLVAHGCPPATSTSELPRAAFVPNSCGWRASVGAKNLSVPSVIA